VNVLQHQYFQEQGHYDYVENQLVYDLVAYQHHYGYGSLIDSQMALDMLD